ncbi:response regulator [Polyangium sp. y55x31]|uniref:response regulator n=1 Tax=Polyangium sp. y55x31 TaxID=3042688 RepID=UPI00248308A3|nr:response regulator [Polyangium sp. y55x31]MDI1483783.1 response regulator [Polyangium sp. y55x31]
MDEAKEILIVEDDALSADVLRRWLGRRGFVVKIAKDGAEGVRLARETPPALVLMDLSLPVLDGLSATRALREAPETRAVPIVMLTGHTTEEIDAACARAGVTAREEKPVDFARLHARIVSILEQGRGEGFRAMSTDDSGRATGC